MYDAIPLFSATYCIKGISSNATREAGEQAAKFHVQQQSHLRRRAVSFTRWTRRKMVPFCINSGLFRHWASALELRFALGCRGGRRSFTRLFPLWSTLHPLSMGGSGKDTYVLRRRGWVPRPTAFVPACAAPHNRVPQEQPRLRCVPQPQCAMTCNIRARRWSNGSQVSSPVRSFSHLPHPAACSLLLYLPQ